MKKLPPKTHNWFIISSFRLVVLDCLVWGKLLTAHMWARYINKNHLLLGASLVDAVMLHHDVSYDLILCHLDLDGKVNN